MSNIHMSLTHIILIINSFFATSCYGKESATSSSEALAYQGDFHKEIIKPQVEAWMEVTKVMYPRVSDDTEAQWAAEQADSIGNALLQSNNLSNGEQLAHLYEMENMIAYGMSYFSAIIGSHSNPEASHEALAMVNYSKADLDSVRLAGFNNPKAIVAYELSTYQNFGLFMELGTQYADDGPQFVTNNMNMQQRNAALCRFFFTHMKDETRAYRYSVIVNNTTFFMTFCPLCFWLAGTDFQQQNQEEYIAIGGWFDGKMSAINDCTDTTELANLPHISLETYSADLKKAAEYKTKLINLLRNGILAMPTNE